MENNLNINNNLNLENTTNNENELNEEKLEKEITIEYYNQLKSHPQSEWYVIHTMSGMEEEVKKIIETKINNLKLKDKIFRIIIPVEKEIKYKAGKKKEINKRLFPGYIFIEMILDNETWSFIKSIQGVTGFVGPQEKPTPLTELELEKIRPFIEGRVIIKKNELNIGDKVRIINGPFKDTQGVVEKIIPEKNKVIVSIIIFGREIPTELDINECEKIE
ncbi:MAG: transcription termination/antitermination protein NusG [bacterium]|nr:transcription termination/antitermination protein NusG [bacterium]